MTLGPSIPDAKAAAAELRIAAERVEAVGYAPTLYASWLLDARQRIDGALALLGLDTVAGLSADLEQVQTELDVAEAALKEARLPSKATREGEG